MCEGGFLIRLNTETYLRIQVSSIQTLKRLAKLCNSVILSTFFENCIHKCYLILTCNGFTYYCFWKIFQYLSILLILINITYIFKAFERFSLTFKRIKGLQIKKFENCCVVIFWIIFWPLMEKESTLLFSPVVVVSQF